LKPKALGGSGWPNFRDPNGVHVLITYNAGHVEVTLTGTEEDGFTPFGPTVVAAADIAPLTGAEAVIGFGAAPAA